jgi:hypothetical protein
MKMNDGTLSLLTKKSSQTFYPPRLLKHDEIEEMIKRFDLMPLHKWENDSTVIPVTPSPVAATFDSLEFIRKQQERLKSIEDSEIAANLFPTDEIVQVCISGNDKRKLDEEIVNEMAEDTTCGKKGLTTVEMGSSIDEGCIKTMVADPETSGNPTSKKATKCKQAVLSK